MEVVGFVFATVATVRLIIEAGTKISQRVAELEDADKFVAHLSDFGVESSRQTLKIQLELGQSVWNDPLVDDGVKDVLDKTFIEIQRTLNTASDQVESTLASSAKKRFHYFAYKRNRDSLAITVNRLRELAKDFKDTIGLIQTARTSPPTTYLSRSIFQVFEEHKIDIMDGVSLRRGQLTIKVGKISPRTGHFVLERRPYRDNMDEEELEDNIKDLTKLLASSDQSEGILDIVGYAKDSKAKCFNLVFSMPEQIQFVATLRDILCNAPYTPALETRIAMCLQLAESVLHVHRLGLVHKNISPLSIAMMTFTDGSSTNSIHQQLLFLLDWHYVRRASNASNRAGETQWWRGVYCHPKRQMQLAQEDYNMGHDIYSLGVCMLEILIWKSLVERNGQGPQLSPLFMEKARHLDIPERNRAELDMRGVRTESELYTANPFGVQQVLVELARTRLPPVAGSRLSQLVVSCLTALEGGFLNISFDRKDDVETAMNFIVAVKMALAQISV